MQLEKEIKDLIVSSLALEDIRPDEAKPRTLRRAFEHVGVLSAPLLILQALPTGGQVLLEYRQSGFQFSPAKHVRVQVASAARVWPEDASAQGALEMLEWLEVPAMQAHLERGLLAIAGE